MKRLRAMLSSLAIGVAALVGVVVLMLMSWPPLALLALALAAWMVLTQRGKQAASLTRIGVSTLPQRLVSSSVVVVGIAGVVGVLVALLAMGEGFRSMMQSTGSENTVIVVRAGVRSEISSMLSHDEVSLITQTAGVQSAGAAGALASPEVIVAASLPRKATGLDASLAIRGIDANAWLLRPQATIVEGRRFTTGLRELVIGSGAHRQFRGAGVGTTLHLNGQEWSIVGMFDSGDAQNSELWGDADVVASAYRRGSSRNSVTLQLQDAGALDAFKAALANEPRLKVDASTTHAFYSAQSERLVKLIRILGTTIGLIMGIGAIFGALNTMYAAVATRAKEIATMRAIGFGGMPVAVSVLIETTMLALLGGILGAAVAWIVFNNYTVSTLGSSFSQIVFAFKVSPELVWTGLKWALAIGFLGGIFPALRAARLPVTVALRKL